MLSPTPRVLRMFEPTPRVIRESSAHRMHDGSFHVAFVALFGLSAAAFGVAVCRALFKKATGWERACMPNRQQRYDHDVWAGGLGQRPEMLETVFQLPHKEQKPRSL
jgi:hypothetical protein